MRVINLTNVLSVGSRHIPLYPINSVYVLYFWKFDVLWFADGILAKHSREIQRISPLNIILNKGVLSERYIFVKLYYENIRENTARIRWKNDIK